VPSVYCDECIVCLSVCLSVHVSVRSHICKTTWPNFIKFSVGLHVDCGRVGPPLAALRYVMYTFGFVIFLHNEPYGSTGALCVSIPIAVRS